MSKLAAALERAALPFRANEPLARHTTLGIGGPVPALIQPRDCAETARALDVLGELGMAYRVLGAGSNLLADDAGLDFAVLATAGLAREPRFAGARVEADAGVFLPRLARTCAERGLEGLEFGIGVPGSVGGALRMNAGAWGSEMARVARSVWAVCAESGRAEELPFAPRFAYRSAGLPERHIVTRVALELTPGDPAVLLKTLERYLAERKRTQPVASRSAGCAFKNPPGDSAGRLVDAAGLKGLTQGAAEVSTRHANFVLNRGGARASDVRKLLAEVKRRVLEAHGVALEEEVVYWSGGGA